MSLAYDPNHSCGVRTVHKELTGVDSRSYSVIRLPWLRLIPEGGMLWRGNVASFIGWIWGKASSSHGKASSSHGFAFSSHGFAPASHGFASFAPASHFLALYSLPVAVFCRFLSLYNSQNWFNNCWQSFRCTVSIQMGNFDPSWYLTL